MNLCMSVTCHSMRIESGMERWYKKSLGVNKDWTESIFQGAKVGLSLIPSCVIILARQQFPKFRCSSCHQEGDVNILGMLSMPFEGQQVRVSFLVHVRNSYCSDVEALILPNFSAFHGMEWLY